MELYVSAQQVAEYLSLTRRQILEMTRRGFIPGHPLGTGSSRRVWRYKLSEIDAVVTEGSRKVPGRAFAHSAVPTTLAAAVPGGSRKGKI